MSDFDNPVTPQPDQEARQAAITKQIRMGCDIRQLSSIIRTWDALLDSGCEERFYANYITELDTAILPLISTAKDAAALQAMRELLCKNPVRFEKHIQRLDSKLQALEDTQPVPVAVPVSETGMPLLTRDAYPSAPETPVKPATPPKKPEPVKPPVAPTPAPPRPPVAPPRPVTPPKRPEPPVTPAPETNSGKRKIWLAVILCVIAVAGLIATIFLVRGCDSDTSPYGAANAEEVLIQIAISPESGKQTYVVGQTLDWSTVALLATYQNGTTKTITDGFSRPTVNFTTPGKQTVTVTFGGKTATLTVEVVPVAISGITISSRPDKLNYYEGETLDTTGLKLTANYNNGDVQTIESNFTCSPEVLTTSGNQTVTVSYDGQTATFAVKVMPATVTGIVLKELPFNCNYFVGDTLDPTGLSLTATYNSGSEQLITEDIVCSPMELTEPGTQEITATYEGQTVTFTVEVVPVAVEQLAVVRKPSKTTYFEGDLLEPAGLELNVLYNNGTKEMISEGFTCSPMELTEPGRQTITVTFEEKTTTFTLDVTPLMPTSVILVSAPNKLSYYVGDTLDTTGMQLDVTWNNGQSTTVDSDFTCSVTKFTYTGTQTVYVHVEDIRVSFRVSVTRPSLTLSSTTGSKSMDCWDSYWDPNSLQPFWLVELPVATTSTGDAVSWSIISGKAYIRDGNIAAQQPGRIVARATYTYGGYKYTKNYTVTLEIYKKSTNSNQLLDRPDVNGNALVQIPANTKVFLTEIYWIDKEQTEDGQYYLWGKTTYNGKTGWVVIS